MQMLVVVLSQAVGTTVIDGTGLKGPLDMALRWEPDTGSAQPPSDIPGLFTALEQQLGLKLEPRKGPTEVIVIDHIERPTPN